MVELSSGTFPNTTYCYLNDGILISAGQITVIPLSSFVGALTAWIDGIRGARYEINFDSKDGSTWYDVDYQLGMSDTTFGPLDGRLTARGEPSLAGEPDTLAKANAAWSQTENKADLIEHPYFVQQGPDGKLNHVYCDAGAPDEVIHFFQVTAQFTAYVHCGSVPGVTPKDPEAAARADTFSWRVWTQDMIIVAY